MPDDELPRAWNTENLRIIAGVVLSVIGVAGYITLAWLQKNSNVDLSEYRGALLFLLGPAAGLFAAGTISPALKALNTKTNQVVKQTNGQLTKHVSDVAEEAARKAVELHAAAQVAAPKRTTRRKAAQ